MRTSPVATSVKLSGTAGAVDATADDDDEGGGAADSSGVEQPATRTTATRTDALLRTRRTLEEDGVPGRDPARASHLGVHPEAVLRRPDDLQERVPHPDRATDPRPLVVVPVERDDQVGARVLGGAALRHLAQCGSVDRLPGDEVDRGRARPVAPGLEPD